MSNKGLLIHTRSCINGENGNIVYNTAGGGTPLHGVLPAGGAGGVLNLNEEGEEGVGGFYDDDHYFFGEGGDEGGDHNGRGASPLQSLAPSTPPASPTPSHAAAAQRPFPDNYFGTEFSGADGAFSRVIESTSFVVPEQLLSRGSDVYVMLETEKLESFYGVGVLQKARSLEDLVNLRKHKLNSSVGKRKIVEGETRKVTYPRIGDLRLTDMELRILEYAAHNELSTEGGQDLTNLCVNFAKAALSPRSGGSDVEVTEDDRLGEELEAEENGEESDNDVVADNDCVDKNPFPHLVKRKFATNNKIIREFCQTRFTWKMIVTHPDRWNITERLSTRGVPRDTILCGFDPLEVLADAMSRPDPFLNPRWKDQIQTRAVVKTCPASAQRVVDSFMSGTFMEQEELLFRSRPDVKEREARGEVCLILPVEVYGDGVAPSKSQHSIHVNNTQLQIGWFGSELNR